MTVDNGLKTDAPTSIYPQADELKTNGGIRTLLLQKHLAPRLALGLPRLSMEMASNHFRRGSMNPSPCPVSPWKRTSASMKFAPSESPASVPASAESQQLSGASASHHNRRLCALTSFAQLPQRMKNVEIVVYEKNTGVGGTWFSSRYPVSCSLQSMSYLLY